MVSVMDMPDSIATEVNALTAVSWCNAVYLLSHLLQSFLGAI